MFLCREHERPENHGCPGSKSPKKVQAPKEGGGCSTSGGCPRCGGTEFSEGAWEGFEDMPLPNGQVDWETRYFWWFRSFDPMGFETIVKKDGDFFLRRVVGGKGPYCKRCGGGVRPLDFAKREVHYCGLDDLVCDVSDGLVAKDIGSFVVRDAGGRQVGLVTDALILRSVSSRMDVGGLRVRDLALEPLVTAGVEADLGEVLAKFEKSPSGRVALVDGRGGIVGVVKEKNLRRFAMRPRD
jgi:CBS domain-containing protein